MSNNNYNLLTFDVNTDEINNCKPIDPEFYNPTDCAINVADFLKIIENNDALNLSKLRNTTKNGTNIDELILFISRKLPSISLKKYLFFDSTNLENPLKKINFDDLKSNKALIGLFASYVLENNNKSYVMGHAVIIAKDIKNSLFIFDRQNNKQINIKNLDDLQNYMNENNFQELYTLIYKNKSPKNNKVSRKLNETTIQIRKQLESSNKTKKQKKNQDFERINRKRKLPSNGTVRLRKKKSYENAKIKKAKKSLSFSDI